MHSDKPLDHKKLFLSNINYEVDEEKLTYILGDKGHNANYIKILRNHDGTSKGQGIIAFRDANEAALALNDLENLKIQNRIIKVKYAFDNQNK